MALTILFFASLWAGVQNALAGGGSFITLPSLMFTGMDARAANITSTIALFPAQVAMGWTGREHVSGAAGLSFRVLAIVSIIGGALGAVLLLVTPSSIFAHMVPWLVLFATAVFAWGSFGPKRRRCRPASAGHRHRGTIRHRDLWRLFRRRHRLSDAGRADGGGPSDAQRRADEECAGSDHERVSGR